MINIMIPLNRSKDFILSGQLPEIVSGFDRPINEQDCLHHVSKAETVLLQCLNGLRLPNLSLEDLTAERGQVIIVPLLLLCSEHSQASWWSSSKSIASAFAILSELKVKLKCHNVCDIFLLEKGNIKAKNILRYCLESLNEKLLPQEWKKYPAAQTSIVWILHQFTFPKLGESLGEFLPFILRFIDDWEVQNRVKGLQCLDHVIKNVNETDLVWYGRADLVQSVLYKLLLFRDIEIVDALLPVYFNFLQLTKGTENSATKSVNELDRVTMKLLQHLEVESDIALKRSFAAHLDALVDLQQERILRWLNRMTRVVGSCLAMPDPEDEACRCSIVKTVTKVIDLVQERITPYTRRLAEELLRVLYECSTISGNEELASVILECLLKLKQTSHAWSNLTDELDQFNVNDQFNSWMKGLKGQ